MAVARRSWLLQLSRSANQRPCTGRVPAPCRRPLAAHAAASQPQGLHHVGTDDAAGGGLAPETDHPSSLAERSLRRHTPKVGAVCGKAARTVLCGGRAMKRTSLPLHRREFITLLGGAAAWPLAARAQQAGKLPTIGFLGATPSAESQRVAAFVQRLRELAWVDGRNLAIEYRWAEGRPERVSEIAAEVVRIRVDVIVTVATPATLAAKPATAVIPSVGAPLSDPVGTGLVTSLARPGSNVTGLANQISDTVGKKLEFLREVVPDLRRLTIVVNVGNPASVLEMGEAQATARTLGLEVTTSEIRRAED